MAGRQIAETKHALLLVKQGKTKSEAARVAGVHIRTVFRALKKLKGKKKT
jgi:hypothetical protein